MSIRVTKLCPMVILNIYIIFSHLHGWRYPRAQLSLLAINSCDFWLDSQAISVTMPVFPWQQECWHSDRGCVPGAGYPSQTGDLAVCLPAADVWRAGALPEQDLTLSRIQSTRWVHTFVLLNTLGMCGFWGLYVYQWKGVCVWGWQKYHMNKSNCHENVSSWGSWINCSVQ